jgi:hypothetical protein
MAKIAAVIQIDLITIRVEGTAGFVFMVNLLKDCMFAYGCSS